MRPVKVDEVTLFQFCHLQSTEEPDPGYAELWSSAGFGRVAMDTFDNAFDMSTTATAVLWRDEDNPSLLGRHWVTNPGSWSAFQANQDAAALEASSWRFIQFYASKDYVYPPVPKPVTWVEHNPVTWGGYKGADIALSVKKHGQGWQWTVRQGASGSDAWVDADTLDAAKTAAEAAIA